MKWAIVLAFCIINVTVAHEDHSKTAKEAKVSEKNSKEAELLAQINENYKRDVKSFFQKSCFDCHSQSPKIPWYYQMPVAQGIMKEDMTEAKKHLDMSKDFPFQGHGSAEEDLKAIKKSIEDKTMPPFRYRALHWGAGLNEEEKQSVLRWIEQSEKALKEEKRE